MFACIFMGWIIVAFILLYIFFRRSCSEDKGRASFRCTIVPDLFQTLAFSLVAFFLFLGGAPHHVPFSTGYLSNVWAIRSADKLCLKLLRHMLTNSCWVNI